MLQVLGLEDVTKTAESECTFKYEKLMQVNFKCSRIGFWACDHEGLAQGFLWTTVYMGDGGQVSKMAMNAYRSFESTA